VSTIATSSLYRKTFNSKSNATILENGVNLKKDFEVYLIHKLKKCILHEAIPSLFYFILTLLVLDIWNDFKFVEWNHFDGLNVEEIMNK
jgi:hypothetical protein